MKVSWRPPHAPPLCVTVILNAHTSALKTNHNLNNYIYVCINKHSGLLLDSLVGFSRPITVKNDPLNSPAEPKELTPYTLALSSA